MRSIFALATVVVAAVLGSLACAIPVDADDFPLRHQLASPEGLHVLLLPHLQSEAIRLANEIVTGSQLDGRSGALQKDSQLITRLSQIQRFSPVARASAPGSSAGSGSASAGPGGGSIIVGSSGTMIFSGAEFGITAGPLK